MESDLYIQKHETEIEQISCEAVQYTDRPLLFDSIAWLSANGTDLNLTYSKQQLVANLFNYSVPFPRSEIKSSQHFQCCTLLDNFKVNCQVMQATPRNGSVDTNIKLKDFLNSHFEKTTVKYITTQISTVDPEIISSTPIDEVPNFTVNSQYSFTIGSFQISNSTVESNMSNFSRDTFIPKNSASAPLLRLNKNVYILLILFYHF